MHNIRRAWQWHVIGKGGWLSGCAPQSVVRPVISHAKDVQLSKPLTLWDSLAFRSGERGDGLVDANQ